MDKNKLRKDVFSSLDDYEERRRAEASAHMDALIAQYRAANGMKSAPPSDHSGMRMNSAPSKMTYNDVMKENGEMSASDAPASSFDSTSQAARDYAYSRDARNQMDDMIRDYKASEKVKRSLDNSSMKGINSFGYSSQNNRNGGFSSYNTDHTDNYGKLSYSGNKVITSKIIVFLILLVIGIILIIFGAVLLIVNTEKANDSLKTMVSYIPVTGTVNSVYKDSGEEQSTRYSIYYTYEFEGNEYKGHTYIDPSIADEMGLDDPKIKNKKITVYADPGSPGNTIIEPIPYPGLKVWLIAAAGFIFIVVSLVYVKIKK